VFIQICLLPHSLAEGIENANFPFCFNFKTKILNLTNLRKGIRVVPVERELCIQTNYFLPSLPQLPNAFISFIFVPPYPISFLSTFPSFLPTYNLVRLRQLFTEPGIKVTTPNKLHHLLYLSQHSGGVISTGHTKPCFVIVR
jgi:hypothetical protein